MGPTKQIFPVEVEPNKLWHAKKAIKEAKKPEFDDIALDLWKVRHCAISHVVMLNSN